MNSKEFFLEKVIREATREHSQSIKMLEVGCGTARYVPDILSKHSELVYVGVEPIQASYEEARKNLASLTSANVFYQLGYDSVPDVEKESFDVVISFSVLEHVKQLGKFMQFCADYLKPGGLMVHRYDLGHALYPGSLKERFHVFLGNTAPALLPERKFVRYVPWREVAREFATKLGNEPYRTTYHQLPNIKALEKLVRAIPAHDESMFETILEWEFAHADTFSQISTSKLEKFFPTVAVWGRKV